MHTHGKIFSNFWLLTLYNYFFSFYLIKSNGSTEYHLVRLMITPNRLEIANDYQLMNKVTFGSVLTIKDQRKLHIWTTVPNYDD